jgi:dihydroorotate dehydrogenase electron transfer subunit
MDEDGHLSARVDCPNPLIPSPGKYILAYEAELQNSILGWPLFPVGLSQPLDESDVPFLGPIPSSWGPGMRLCLRGPLGHGFQIPPNIRRLALGAFGDTPSRLLPLIDPALKSGADVAFFSASTLPPLPPEVEIRSLNALPDVLAWADYLAVDIPRDSLSGLRKMLKLEPHAGLPCQVQALVSTPMPCAGVGDCGACAVKARQGYKLACVDGPVFDLSSLDW